MDHLAVIIAATARYGVVGLVGDSARFASTYLLSGLIAESDLPQPCDKAICPSRVTRQAMHEAGLVCKSEGSCIT